MNIKVEKWLVDRGTTYKILEIEQCKCGKLTKSKNISINSECDEFEPYCDDKGNNYSVKISRDEYDYDGWYDTYYEEIKYCPWCGEKIEIEIANTIDKIEEYKSLQEKRDLLWNKHNKTDSINQTYVLKQKVRELDLKINSMLMSDDFEKESEDDNDR